MIEQETGIYLCLAMLLREDLVDLAVKLEPLRSWICVHVSVVLVPM
jgi:hypothetical protein